MENAKFPKDIKQTIWLKEDLLIARGYSTEDIVQMDQDRFDFLVYLAFAEFIKRMKFQKPNPTLGGI